MKVYQLKRIKKKQVFDDVFPTEFDVFLYERKEDAVKSANDYYDMLINKFDRLKQHAALQDGGSHSIFTEKPESIEQSISDNDLTWTVKAYIQDVIHEITLSIKENIVIPSNTNDLN